MDSMAGIPDLSTLPGFAADDVAANLGGRLSEAQTRILRVEVRNRGVGLVAIVAFSIFSWANGANLFWLGVLAIVVSSGIYRFVVAIAEMGNPLVGAVEGSVLVERDGDGDHALRVGGKRFSLSNKASTILIPGGPYRVFFLERANLLVGAQVLPGWRPNTSPSIKRRFPFSIGIG